MDYLIKGILNQEEIEEFKGLLNRSSWLSILEKDQFLGKSLPHPPGYLVHAAYDAVKEEAEFYAKVKEHALDVYDYLNAMQGWIDREDINYARIRENKIKHALAIYGEDMDTLYFPGDNFHDILEIFKILFQNVVYHASAQGENENITINIIANMQHNDPGAAEISVEFSSRHDTEVDTTSLMELVCDNNQRQ